MLDEPDTIRAFLYQHHIFEPAEPVSITFLSGGVSSLVVKAQAAARCVVVKQALPRLKVRDEWISRVERSLVEARCSRVLDDLVPGSVPLLLAVDEPQRAFVMTCAREGAATWKEILMAGHADVDIAAAVGSLLGKIHAGSAERFDLAAEFDDRSFFDELRLDPYLRTIGVPHPDLVAPLNDIIALLVDRRVCLVHGDFSPKNLLVGPEGELLLLDHEVAHWGNPAFDTAFVLNHLCLKALKFRHKTLAYVACAHTLWEAYMAQSPPGGADLASHTALVLGGLLLARVDGKSPVEYLQSQDERGLVRSLARELIAGRVSDVDTVFDRVATAHAHA
jgi:aminoglycoside phosphotransferase (APT) family kinase protein